MFYTLENVKEINANVTSKIYNTFSRYFTEHLQPNVTTGYCFVLKCLKPCSFYTLRVMSHIFIHATRLCSKLQLVVCLDVSALSL